MRLRHLARWCATTATLLALMPTDAGAEPELHPSVHAIAPQVDAAALPPLDDPAAETNPYRNDARVLAIGREAFNQACARCHGVDADARQAPAPDLRRVGRACGRLVEGPWKQRCQTDADVYFRHSVEQGKVKVGVVHMPPWRGVLSTELIWAIRSFVASPLAAPRAPDLTSVEAAAGR